MSIFTLLVVAVILWWAWGDGSEEDGFRGIW